MDDDTIARLEFREALRGLLLPVAPEREAAVLEAAAQALARFDVAKEDRAVWVRHEFAEWRANGFPSDELHVLVGDCLEAGDPQWGAQLAAEYMGCHAWLCEQPLFSHSSASALLSQARLMLSLARDEQMAAAPIARIVAARDQRLSPAWAHVKHVLERLRCPTPLSQAEVERLHTADSLAEEALFADSDAQEAAERLGEVASSLGYPEDLTSHVLHLVPRGEAVYGPYLQMLHFLCVIAEFYDSALGDLYEFKPRGAVSEWLFAQYPPSLNVAGNPFLNNAKSVARLDRRWAMSKRPAAQRAAYALAAIVEGMEGMSFLARQELAAWLRAWLCREIRLARGMHVTLPAALSAMQVQRLVSAVAQGNTGSRGIIEQRVVDALASLRHSGGEWVSRGLGDSVNANNVSRRKCGDCDFQDAVARRVVAYEAHGGVLSDVYLREHRRTLELVLDRRREEWAGIAGADSRWQVEVVFVAHGRAHDLDLGRHHVAGVEASFRVMTYSELLGVVPDGEALRAAVNHHVVGALSDARTPDVVRGVCRTLIGC